MNPIQVAKLSSSVQADEALDRMVKVTNEGFTAGRLTKTEMLSWVVQYFEEHLFEKCMEKIREAHFDQVAYLKNVVKEMESARKAGTDTQDLGALLAPLTTGRVTASNRKRVTPEPEVGKPSKNRD